MSKVLVLGAGGQIARHVIEVLGNDGGFEMTLFLRNTGRISALPPTPASSRATCSSAHSSMLLW